RGGRRARLSCGPDRNPLFSPLSRRRCVMVPKPKAWVRTGLKKTPGCRRSSRGEGDFGMGKALKGGAWLAAALAVVGLWACKPAPKPGAVDQARLTAADQDQNDWLSYGRTYSEQRFSPLTQVNTGNVGQLGLAWHYQFDTERGQEATPLMVDGTLYTT